MFGIGKLFARRAARKRSIFHFHDGQRHRWIDPMQVEAAMERQGGENWQDTVILVRNLHRPMAGLTGPVAEDRKEARRRETGKLLALVRESFGVLALTPEGKGMTEVETIGLLTDYLLFAGRLADAARPLADSPPPTEELSAV